MLTAQRALGLKSFQRALTREFDSAGEVQCGVMKDFISQFNFYQVDLIPAQTREIGGIGPE
jgi:hypothetical protein